MYDLYLYQTLIIIFSRISVHYKIKTQNKNLIFSDYMVWAF